jgi:hypothetical protein
MIDNAAAQYETNKMGLKRQPLVTAALTCPSALVNSENDIEIFEALIHLPSCSKL